MSDKNSVLFAVADTMKEINELLRKSGHDLEKDEASEQQPEQDALQDQAAQEQEQQQPEAPQAPEMQQEQAPEAQEEGQEQPSDESQELQAHAKDMSDEELDMMLEILMQEKESRSAQQQEGQAPQAPEMQQEQPPMQEEAEKSMKEDFKKLSKSLETMTSAIEKIGKEVAELKSKPVAAPAKAKVATKPAAANTNVQVLEKSAPVKQRLSKSETIDFLMNKMRERSPIVNSTMIRDVNAAQTDSDLATIQDELTKVGVTLPEIGR